MDKLRKRLLSGFLTLVMVFSLLPAQAFADELEGAEDETGGTYDYMVMVTHALELDGETYGQTDVIPLTEDDFQDGAYDIHNAVLDKTGLEAVKASWLDMEEGELVEGWTVAKSAFEMGGDPDDGSAYYAAQLLIEYEVAEGYEATVSDEPGSGGDYGVMPLAEFKGDLSQVTITGVDIITLTLKFAYSPTGGLSGVDAADTVKVEIPVTKDSDGNVISVGSATGNVIWDPATQTATLTHNLTTKDGFRMLVNPYPLNQFLVNPTLATEMTRNPNPDTIATAIADGSFSVVPSKVYANGTSAAGGYVNLYDAAWDLSRHSYYNDDPDRLSAKLNEIATYWNNRENLGAVTVAELQNLLNGSIQRNHYHVEVSGDTANPGANSVGSNPKVTVEMSLEQAKELLAMDAAERENHTTVTVYYRRNATSYTVRHWVLTGSLPTGFTPPEQPANKPAELAQYTMVYTEALQGRVGALTNAQESPAVTAGGNQFDFAPYMAEGFSQQEIIYRDTAHPDGTVINITYSNASGYRVIFNTNYTYIPRVTVEPGNTLDITNVPDYHAPSRTGYTFAGWRYRVKDSSVAGAYPETEDGQTYYYVNVTNNTLEFNTDLIRDAVITQAEAGDNGVKALSLYPKWNGGTANVRVVFWVEDLTGANDVQVSVTNQNNSTYWNGLDQTYKNAIVPGGTTAAYSNMGSFTLSATTGTALDLSASETGGATTALTGSFSGGSQNVTVGGTAQALSAAVQAQFQTAMGTVDTSATAVQAYQFYHPVRVVYGNGSGNNTSVVSSDGSTVVNVYYNRNIYALDFTYYGKPNNGTPRVAVNTNGFAGATGNDRNPDPNASNRYADGDFDKESTTNPRPNGYKTTTGTESSFTVARRVTIQAKYGADLREVWPSSNGETISVSDDTINGQAVDPTFISWTTTIGPYNDKYRNDLTTDRSHAECTLMGRYSAMGADIIANPATPTTTHHLYAYWCWYGRTSTYRYNHCFAVPSLNAGTIANQAAVTVRLNGNSTNTRDLLYLIPTGAITEYGDLLKVNANGLEDANGSYYAVRVWNGACYVVARQVVTVSTNSIQYQNPSARLHMTRVATNLGTTYAPDHSTNYANDAGATGRDTNGIGSAANPCNLYFYYSRDQHTITYMAPANNENAASTEVTLGTWQVPHGTLLTTGDYRISGLTNANAYTWSNTNNAFPWTAAAETPVCPDRSSTGTKPWSFGGWYLNRACTQEMDWDQSISGNIRLYAKWTNDGYTVRFVLNGGTLISGDNTRLEQTISANTRFSAVGIIPRPTRNGYTLQGWYVQGTNTPFDFDEPVTADVTVEARWDRGKTNNYSYTVYYLREWEDGDTGERRQEGSTWYKVLGKDEVRNAPCPPNTILWLAAKPFEGCIPQQVNQSVTLDNAAIEKIVSFYYNKTQTSTYKINFANPNSSNVALTVDKTGVEVPTDGITNDMLASLNAAGYTLARQQNGNWVAVNSVGEAQKLDTAVDEADVTYAVIPIQYNITYGVSSDVASDLQSAAGIAVGAVTGTNAHPGVVSNGRNPVVYDVEDTFTITNPGFIQKADGTWMRFAGWRLGTGTTEVNIDPTAGAYSPTNVEVENSVGNLNFLATWEDATPNLTVTKNVTEPSGVPAPANDEFSFTIALPANADDVVMYRSGAAGADAATRNGPVTVADTGATTFGLRDGETLNVIGPQGQYTVTELVDGDQATKFDNTQRNYYVRGNIHVVRTNDDGTTSEADQANGTATIMVGERGAAATVNNEYHATVDLDLDPVTTGNQGLPFTKNLTGRTFQTSDTFNFRVATSTGSPLPGTPVEVAGVGSYSLGTITGVNGGTSRTGRFDSVKFDRVANGTDDYPFFTYTLREERPNAGDNTFIPGVTYDGTLYRITVTTGAVGNNLAVTNILLERRTGGDTYATVGNYNPGVEDDLNALTAALTFTNTYDPDSTTTRFSGRKVYTNRAGTALPLPTGANAFQFSVTLEGSHAVTAEEATQYHALTDGTAKNSFWASRTFTVDANQPRPASTTVTPGAGGIIQFPGITYNRNTLQGNALGRVYKYTVREVLPGGQTVRDGITYDTTVATLYSYVHLHDNAYHGGNYLTTGGAGTDGDGTVVYAEILGDRDHIFRNTYSSTPVIVDLGGDSDPATNTVGVSLTKHMSGRSFTAGDSFTFDLAAQNGAPLPAATTATITPTSGNDVQVKFGKITFDTSGTYRYTLKERQGTADKITYDTAEKVLEIIVADDGTGKLAARVTSVTWTNLYKDSEDPKPPIDPDDPDEPDEPSRPSGGGGSSSRDRDDKPATVTLNTSDHYAYILGKSDGLVHPEANITRAEVATVFYRLLTEESRKAMWTKENPYPDVPSSMWCNIAVSVMSNAGVIKGRVNGKFDPYANITRGEFATIAARFLSDPYHGEDFFPDISEHWAREYINRAANAGWVRELHEPFRPNDYITRAEVMSLVNAMIGRAPDKDHMHEDMITWEDNMDTTKWYYEDVQEATNSHEYVRAKGYMENWTEILPVRDWKAIEAEWANIYDAVNPGDVTTRGGIAKR